MNLIDILTRYMTPFEARLCIQEMRRCGMLPPDVKVIEGEFVVDEKEFGDDAN